MKKNAVKRKTVSRQPESPSIFEQLGFDEVEAAALERKSALFNKVVTLASERNFTQKKLSTLLGISQPHVSQLLGGKISRFSVEKLIEFAERVGADVKIVVRRKAS